MTLDVCTYENRPNELVALKLLVLSLARQEPEARVHVPTAGMPQASLDWLSGQANVALHPEIELDGKGWDVKPSILIGLLEGGLEQVVWMDADIIAARPLGDLFSGMGPETLGVADEAWRPRRVGTRIRAQAHGLPGLTELGFTANTCIVRATRSHLRLLEDWLALLKGDAYRAAQAGHWAERPFHLLGDQDLLNAVLGARPGAERQVRRVRSGRDIAHCFLDMDYTFGERVRAAASGGLRLYHAHRSNPWLRKAAGVAPDFSRATSPYRIAAKRYAAELEPEERTWLENDGPFAGLAQRLSFGRPDLAGLAPAARGSFRRALSRAKSNWVRACQARAPRPDAAIAEQKQI
ncbi:hypothetical protein [Albimonas pacifica]|uniref:Glycosyl transferase family 8 n=1 Tax=Albimonas pacifica TaxID=1114924 RepID=A0A1I3FER0_9RHOB|nr:hypothetical protein [Albimonas pacifica]SFI09670.1 hypothetical protein SAMN05216258_104236 [Albimonas pacifica]